MYYFNARWYNADLGKFISEYPAGASTNWLEYALGNPIKYTAHTGLDARDFYDAMTSHNSLSEQNSIADRHDNLMKSPRRDLAQAIVKFAVDKVRSDKYKDSFFDFKVNNDINKGNLNLSYGGEGLHKEEKLAFFDYSGYLK